MSKLLDYLLGPDGREAHRRQYNDSEWTLAQPPGPPGITSWISNDS